MKYVEMDSGIEVSNEMTQTLKMEMGETQSERLRKDIYAQVVSIQQLINESDVQLVTSHSDTLRTLTMFYAYQRIIHTIPYFISQ